MYVCLGFMWMRWDAERPQVNVVAWHYCTFINKILNQIILINWNAQAKFLKSCVARAWSASMSAASAGRFDFTGSRLPISTVSSSPRAARFKTSQRQTYTSNRAASSRCRGNKYTTYLSTCYDSLYQRPTVTPYDSNSCWGLNAFNVNYKLHIIFSTRRAYCTAETPVLLSLTDD